MLVNLTNNSLGYNATVDITVFFFLLIFILISFNTAQIKGYGVNCLRAGVILTLMATICKLVFFLSASYTGGTSTEVVSYILFYLYNVFNLTSVCAYIEYMLHVVGEKSIFCRCIRIFYKFLFILSLLTSLIRGIVGEVLYFDKHINMWYINTSGFTFEVSLYGLMTLGLFVLVINRRHFIKQVYITLLITNILDLALFVITSSLGDTSFANFIVLLPFMIVLLMLYTVPFNFITGALTYTNFERYLEQRKGKKVSYIVVYFKKDMTGITFNQESGKFLYTFWRSYFIDCFLFEIYTNMYVLAIEDNFIKHENIDMVIREELLPFANAMNMDFKIYGLLGVDFIANIGEFFNLDLYFANNVKKNSYVVFDEPMVEKARYITDIVDALMDIAKKRDLDDERVLVYCQPVKNIKTNKFDTAEALMRLELPNIGFIYPDVFIPLAESFNYIHVLSLIILNKTCEHIRYLLDNNYIVERISVNFCVKEFKQDSFCDEVLNIIGQHNIPYNKIAIELTESKNEEDYDLITSKINRLKEYGIKFYLDDFGTGYSNFDRILGLNLDIVKFDKSLLNMAETNKNTKFVLTHFSSAFKKLDYQILFEGVETESQISLCVASKADYLQGYKYSKPIDMSRLTEFFSKHSTIEEVID